MRKIKKIIFPSLLCFVTSIASAQTGSISGFVYDAVDYKPISEVEVCAYLAGGTYFEQKVATSGDGSYSINNLPVGLYSVRVFNSKGYVNEFYNNVLEQSQATLLKINADEAVTNINFYLKKGGFITGHVYSTDGRPISTYINISFFDANSKTLRGSSISDVEGYYISPALPVGNIVVMAGDTKQGYIITFYNRADNWNSAEIINIASEDTLSGIDFYLKKGGAISGKVMDENDPNKYPRAWIVVEDWETGQWCSETWSDSVTGYYCAGGLPSGIYRVYVFSVDPTKYHTQYFYKATHKENAEPVIVNSPNTKERINFYLIPVTYLSKKNDYVHIEVCDKYPGTNFTLGTTGGLPDTEWDDNKPLLFGHPWPHTSYTTVRINDKSYIFGSSDGDYLFENNQRLAPHFTEDGRGITWSWIYNHLQIDQTISIVKSEWSEKKIFDTAKIRYALTNTGYEPQEVGLRILLDTMLGDNDGAPIKTPDGIYTDHERDFFKPNIPDFWTAVEGDSTKTIFSAQGTLVAEYATPPDRFAIVKWKNIYDQPWIYQTKDTCKIIFDSAVALWWNPILLNKNESREIVAYYGLGEMIPDTIPPYITNPVPDRNQVVNPDININLTVQDDYMGVNGTSIKMWVNGQRVHPDTTSSNNRQYLLFYDPPQDFSYGQEVIVKIEAEDRAYSPNKMDTTYSFFIINDNQPPYIEQFLPDSNSSNVPINTGISFHVKDDLSGVDSTSVKIIVNNDTIPQPQFSGSIYDYFVQIKPLKKFHYNDTVKVIIIAADLADSPNSMTEDYSFAIQPDREPPYVDQITPIQGSKEVPINTEISFHIKDQLAGVDHSKILIIMNKDTIHHFSIYGDSSDYFITVKPSSKFKYNQTVSIKIQATDLAIPANPMNPFDWAFEIKKDQQPPFITQIDPDSNAINVPLTPEISFHILDSLAGVDRNSIRLTINELLCDINDQISGDSSDYVVKYVAQTSFFYKDTVKVRILASDLAEPANTIVPPVEYQFYIIRDTIPPIIKDFYPPKFATHVPLDAYISFTVRDEHSGVAFVKLLIEGIEATLNKENENKYIFKPSEIFSENDTIDVEIKAGDRVSPPNIITERYYFVTMNDTVPPWTEGHQPSRNATGVLLQPEISLCVKDDFTGIDSSSIVMKIDQNQASPKIEALDHGYKLSYKPDTIFHYNQIIEISINAQDLARIPNEMPTDRYYLHIVEDHDPPYLSKPVPAPGDTGIIRKTSISFHLIDLVSGIDSSSIKLFVNNLSIESFFIDGSKNDYYVKYQPLVPFTIGETVSVNVMCGDNSNPPNTMDTTFIFTISKRRDTQTPYVTDQNPKPYQSGVSPDVEINFHIKDDYSGVDKSSIVLRVNQSEIKPEIQEITIFDYLVSYKPEENFTYNDSIHIEIEARDLAETANEMDVVSYHFYIEKDLIPPRIVFTTPGDSATNVPLTTDILFNIFDDQLGIDSNSILMWIDQQKVNPQSSGNKNHITLVYKASEPFKYNQQVTIKLSVHDLSNPPNSSEHVFSFYTIEDKEPPFISSCNPEKNAVQVDFMVTISFHIEDKISGVDISSIFLEVNNKTVDYDISGVPINYLVTYQTPTPGFVSGQIVDINIRADDLSDPPNPMSETYSFTIKDMLPDLIATISVDSPSIIVHHTVILTAEVLVKDAPIKSPFQTILKNADQIIKTETINQMGINDIVQFNFPLALHDKGTHKIFIEVDTGNLVNESDETNNLDFIYINVMEGRLIVRSNPFTPNSDGYNDVVGFDFREFDLNAPILKIYDFQGRNIITLEDHANSKFIWDGRNRNGQDAQPGVYLYILQDGNRNIGRGYVVLAR